MMSSTTFKIFYYKINLIGIHQIIYLKFYSMEEEYRTSSNFHRSINIVEIIIPSAPPTIQCRYDSMVHEFYISTANVSIGIAKDLIIDRLISNFRVWITRIGYATYTYKNHHKISADLLAR